MFTSSVTVLLLLAATVLAAQQVPPGKVVEIEPVALDVVIPVYDKVVVMITNQANESTTRLYEQAVGELVGGREDAYEKVLFALCDASKDVSGKLAKYANHSVYVVTSVHRYELLVPGQQARLEGFFKQDFVDFVQSKLSPKLDLTTESELLSRKQVRKYVALFTVENEEQLAKLEKIHHKIYDFLEFFNITFAANSEYSQPSTLGLYRRGIKYNQYARSAIQALLNFTDSPSKSEINDLLDFLNVQTIGDVCVLNDDNYFRVFGSSVEFQMLLVYRADSQHSEQLEEVREAFRRAGEINRREMLSYERVLFAEASAEFLADYFSDELLEPYETYKIVMTKTQYSSFQLRKFIFTGEEVRPDLLVKFLSGVRMKEIEAQYKSEPIPDNTDQKIRKIVGKNFEKEIFQQQQKSTLVLFLDSKDPEVSTLIEEALDEFVDKYYDAVKEHLHIAKFDLAKNQHKLLSISTAPELLLFERSNKKRPKTYRMQAKAEYIKNWLNYELKDVTIPENYGEPPIALGSSQL